MMRKIAIFTSFMAAMVFGHLSINACMCPGVNPSIYPADIPKFKQYYRDEFKGAAFTGKLVSSKEIPGKVTSYGDKLLELTVNVDRAWLGVNQPRMTVFTSDNPCGVRFRENESYFFLPTLEEGQLYISPCTYASYSSKSDGDFVDLMKAMFGGGKKFGAKGK